MAAGKPAAAAGGTIGRRKSIKKKVSFLCLVTVVSAEWWKWTILQIHQMIDAPRQAKDGKKLELAQVIAPYEATSKEQLSLVQVSNKSSL